MEIMTTASRTRSRSSIVLVLTGFAAVLAGLVLSGKALLLDGRQSGGAHARAAQEVPVTSMNRSIGPGNNSPTLLSDPADPAFVVLANRLDAPDFSCALHVSGDGGRSWAPVNPVPKLPDGAEKCYAPEVAFDRHGVLYYLFVGLAGRGNEPVGAFLATSEDRGRSFTAPRQVLGPLNFSVRMAIEPAHGDAGRIHLVWIKATSDPPLGGFGPPPNPILAAYSDDGGRSFTEPVQVNNADRERVVAPALAIGTDQRVHVAYYDLGNDAVDYQGLEGPVWEGTWSLIFATSSDGGRRFGEGSVIEAEVVPPERVLLIFTMAPPALVVRGDQICAAWTDGRNGDQDAFARCSSDSGRRWSVAHRLNDDQVGNGLTQSMPRLAFSPDGRLDAIFNDRRRHPANVLNYVFFTSSRDSGRTWTPNVQLTRHASSSLVGQRYTNASAQDRVEFGSRLGLLSREREAVVAWTDTRNSDPDSTGQDIFSTIVEHLPASSGSRLRRTVLAGTLITALGAALLVGVLRKSSSRSMRPAEHQAAKPADDG